MCTKSSKVGSIKELAACLLRSLSSNQTAFLSDPVLHGTMDCYSKNPPGYELHMLLQPNSPAAVRSCHASNPAKRPSLSLATCEGTDCRWLLLLLLLLEAA
jgi:hypothetical protein